MKTASINFAVLCGLSLLTASAQAQVYLTPTGYSTSSPMSAYQPVENRSVNYQPVSYSQPAYTPASYSQPVAYNQSQYVASVPTTTAYYQQPGTVQPIASTSVYPASSSYPTTTYYAPQTGYAAQAGAACGCTQPVSSYYPQQTSYSPTSYAYQPVSNYQQYPPVTSYRPVAPAPTTQTSYYVGRGVVGQPTIYVPGQPIRNFFRSLSP